MEDKESLSLFTRKVIIAFLIISIGILLMLLVKHIFPILLLVFASVLFGVFLIGLSKKVHNLTNVPEKYSIWIVIVLFFAILGGLFYFVGDQIAGQFSQLSDTLTKAFNDLQGRLSQYSWWSNVREQIPDLQKALQTDSSVKKVFGVFSSTLGIVADLLIFIALSLFIATNPGIYRRGIVLLFPKSKTDKVKELLNDIHNTLFRWLSGRIIDMIVLGVLTAIGLWIIGIPLPVTLGILTAILSFIPNIGPFLAVIPPIILALSMGMNQVLYVILLFIGIQLIESYFLTPFIQKKAVELPPVILLVSQLIFVVFGGLLGLLLATPITAVLLVIIRKAYIRDTLHKDIDQ